MSLLESVKKGLKEAINKEAKAGVKEYLMTLGGGLVMCIGTYLYASHAVEFGRRVGRGEMLDKLSDTAEKLDSLNADIDEN